MNPISHTPASMSSATSSARLRSRPTTKKPAAHVSAFAPGLVQQEKPEAASEGLRLTLQPRGSGETSVRIRYGIVPGRFGDCLIAATDHGICWLDLRPSRETVSELCNYWASADVRADHAGVAPLAAQIFAGAGTASNLPLHLKGTEFQLRVWSALLGIRAGHWMSYGSLARELGSPRAARAVGSAVGANNVALLVPCHRVLPAGGSPGNYRWGAELKCALLRDESARAFI